MTTIKCPSCYKTFEIEGDYDADFEAPTTCFYCDYSASTFCFDYVYIPTPEECEDV